MTQSLKIALAPEQLWQSINPWRFYQQGAQFGQIGPQPGQAGDLLPVAPVPAGTAEQPGTEPQIAGLPGHCAGADGRHQHPQQPARHRAGVGR